MEKKDFIIDIPDSDSDDDGVSLDTIERGSVIYHPLVKIRLLWT